MRLFRNKQFKQITCLLIAAVMLICVAPINVAAAVSSGRSVTVSNPYSSMTFVGDTGDTIVDVNSSVAATSVSKELKIATTFSYTKSNLISGSYYGKVFPITVSSGGTLVFNTKATYLQKDVNMCLYFDEACTNYVGYVDAPSLDGNQTADEVSVPQGGTYYLEVYSSNWSDSSFTNTIYMETSFYTSNNLTLSVNNWYNVASTSNEVYYRVDVPGTGYVTLYGNGGTDLSVSYYLCDSAKKEMFTYSDSLKSSNGYRATYRLTKGVYYVKVRYSYADNDHYRIKWAYNANDYTMSNNVWTTVYPGNYDSTTYLKFKANQNGYITVTLNGADTYCDSGKITLCNSKKVAISETEWVWADSTSASKQAVFGVKKGSTYYLKLNNADGKTAVKYNLTKVSEKSGAKKSKAVTIKKNKNAVGTIVAGENKSDWYKIKLTKKQVLKFVVSGGCSGYIKLELYYSNGKKYSTYSYMVSDSNTKQTLKTYGKLNKGTYYVKISRYDSNSSGYYKLKWK